MPSRSLARSAACAVVALVSASAPFAAADPPIPPVAEIPVAPLQSSRRASPPTAAAMTTTTTTTTTTTAPPALEAVVAAPTLPGSGGGAVEAMPAPPPPIASLHVVLVDELPFRATHAHARELPEHAHHAKKHGRHGRPFHPAPGVVVDVPDASGGVSAAELQRTARNVGYWPFRRCYEEGLRRDQHLGGKVSIDLGLAPGPVNTASVSAATLHDESVVLCVAREAQHLVLSPADAAGTARLSVTLATGDEPVPVPHAVPHAEDLRDALRAAWPAVQQCYGVELGKHPDAGGRLELKFRVRSGGEIAEVAEEGDARFGDVDLTRCVLGVYRSAKLRSASHAIHEGAFVYALHFEARPEHPPVAVVLRSVP